MKKTPPAPPDLELPEWIKILERDFGTELVRFAIMDSYRERVRDFVSKTTKDLSMQELSKLAAAARGAKL